MLFILNLGFTYFISPRLVDSPWLVVGGVSGIAMYMLLILVILSYGNPEQHEGIMDAEVKTEVGLFKTRIARDVGDPGAAFDWENVFRCSFTLLH